MIFVHHWAIRQSNAGESSETVPFLGDMGLEQRGAKGGQACTGNYVFFNTIHFGRERDIFNKLASNANRPEHSSILE